MDSPIFFSRPGGGGMPTGERRGLFLLLRLAPAPAAANGQNVPYNHIIRKIIKNKGKKQLTLPGPRAIV